MRKDYFFYIWLTLFSKTAQQMVPATLQCYHHISYSVFQVTVFQNVTQPKFYTDFLPIS